MELFVPLKGTPLEFEHEGTFYDATPFEYGVIGDTEAMTVFDMTYDDGEGGLFLLHRPLEGGKPANQAARQEIRQAVKNEKDYAKDFITDPKTQRIKIEDDATMDNALLEEHLGDGTVTEDAAPLAEAPDHLKEGMIASGSVPLGKLDM